MNKRLFLSLLCCLFAASNDYARSPSRPDVRSYIVVLKGPALSRGAFDERGKSLYKGISHRDGRGLGRMIRRRRDMESKLIRFENRLKRLSAGIRPRRRFTGLLNGLSLEMPRGVASRIRSMPDVLAIVPNRRYNYSLTRSNDLMNAPTAWQLTGGEELAGRGIKIGIIDTGIDHTHVMFGDEGYQPPEGYPLGDTDFTNNKIIVARVFTKGGDSAIDSTPRDRNGHGTHVASCAAGNFNTPSPLGSMSGFAPNAYLGNYKVFTGDFTTLEQIIGALEACVEDGMDVVNLSLGSEDYINSLLDPEALAIRNAVSAGVVVVAAAGNSGRAETIGSPGQIPEVITVGSLTNGHTGTSSGELGIAMMNVYSDGRQILTDEQVVLGPDPEFFSCPLLGRFQIVDADLLDGGRYGGDQHGLACVSLPAGSAQDKWVLVQRGTCTFTEKIFNVEDAGGWGALIYNKAGAEEGPDGLMRDPPPLVSGTMLPSYFSSRNVGLTVKEALADGGVVEVEFYAPMPFERNQTPLELSTFSSAGPSLSYVIKPEISAIGEGSYAATQNDLPGEFKFNSIDYTSFDLSGFGFSSGTSFSSPRVAGVAALIKQANPSWKPEDIKSAIVISAQRPPGLTSLSGMERGAGHVDPVRAMDLPLTVTPATLSWENVLIDETTEARKSIRLKNLSQQFQSVSLTLGLPTEGCLQAVEMSPGKVDLAPSESIEISINLTLSPPAELGQTEDISGDVILEITGESHPLRVPVWARIMNAPPAQGAILLIDDDGGESIETQYIDAVDRAGYEVTLWDVAQLEAYPSVLYMQKFQAVSWFLATTSLYNITDNMLEVNERIRFNVALTEYLARGGRLLVSGQDWSDDQEQTLFGQQVLHISEFTHDPFVQYTPIGDVDDFEETLVISGVLDSPITEGITSLSADFNDTFVNMTDLLVVDETGIAKPALTANQNPLDVIGITIETDSYRAAFFSFGLERIDPGGRTRDGMDIIVRNSLDWLMGGSSTRLAIRSVKPRVQIDNTVALKVTLTAEGVNFPIGHDVRLNERSVEINSIDMTGNLEILIPAGLPRGLYDITLSSPDGQTTTLAQAFEVQGPT